MIKVKRLRCNCAGSDCDCHGKNVLLELEAGRGNLEGHMHIISHVLGEMVNDPKKTIHDLLKQ